MKQLPSEVLEQRLKAEYPPDATSWSDATEEVRDMYREARKLAGVSDETTLNFRLINDPAQWNTQGIAGIMKFYGMLDVKKQQEFCSRFKAFY